jgi:hypothetical protein
VTLTNTGNAPLSVSNIQVTGDFAQTNNCPATLAPNATCAASITFTPTVTGTRSGTMTFTDNASNSPQSVSLSGSGLSPAVGLSPASLTFSGQALGTSSAAQTVTLTNTGTAPLSVSSIKITGDFAQTNNCPATLASNTSCAASITFAPTATGSRSGTLTFTDNASNSPQAVSLSGSGLSPAVGLSPASLTFSAQALGTSSTAQTVTLTNTGNAPLSVSSVQVTGDFAQTNKCPATLASNATCAVSITFTPRATGNRSGTLTISDNAQGSPQTLAVAGTGSDFGLTSSPKSNTVKAGKTASYTLTISPLGGSFNNAVQLSCSGAPALTTCSLASNTMTPAGNATADILTITTTAAAASAARLGSLPGHPIYAIWAQLGFGLFGAILVGYRARARKLRMIVLAVLVTAALLFMFGCAGGTGITTPPPSGTTPGTYTITVSGTSGTLQHSIPVTLIVQ